MRRLKKTEFLAGFLFSASCDCDCDHAGLVMYACTKYKKVTKQDNTYVTLLGHQKGQIDIKFKKLNS